MLSPRPTESALASPPADYTAAAVCAPAVHDGFAGGHERARTRAHARSMRIVQAVFGVFHHFELGRELANRGHLEKIFSTFPWARLRREGLDHRYVATFPWIQTPELALEHLGLGRRSLIDPLGYANALAFDEWTYRKISDCDAFIAIAGAGLKTGRLVQRRGGKYVCDRGSTHIRNQHEIMREEHARWGLPPSRGEDTRDMDREEIIYATCDALTVPSHFAASTFIARGIPAEKVTVIPYGVQLDRFNKVADPPDDHFEVLYVGQVCLRKGFPYLLQAFSALNLKRKHLRVIGNVANELKPLLSRLSLANVTFHGALPQVQLKGWMSRSHVLVLPSVEEGLALVQGQALACGCPVIATPNTGAEDLLTDNVDSFIVPPRNVAALTAAMQCLAEDPAKREQMSEQALRTVRNLEGWGRYGARWEGFLRDLTGVR